MRKIYAELETKDFDLTNIGGICNSKLKYYITKDNEYGIEVVKTQESKNSITTEIKNIINVTTDESKIEKILDVLVERRVLPYVAEDVIHDLVIGCN